MIFGNFFICVCAFLTFVKCDVQNLQNQNNESISPFLENNGLHREHDKRTIFNNDFGWAKHIRLRGKHKVLLGYSPVNLQYVPVVKPLNLKPPHGWRFKPKYHRRPKPVRPQLHLKPVYKPVVHLDTSGWKPVIPPHIPAPPSVNPKPWQEQGWTNKPGVTILNPVVPAVQQPLHPPHTTILKPSVPFVASHVDHVHVDDVHHVDQHHHIDQVHHVDQVHHIDQVHHVDQLHHVDHVNHGDHVHHVDHVQDIFHQQPPLIIYNPSIHVDKPVLPVLPYGAVFSTQVLPHSVLHQQPHIHVQPIVPQHAVPHVHSVTPVVQNEIPLVNTIYPSQHAPGLYPQQHVHISGGYPQQHLHAGIIHQSQAIQPVTHLHPVGHGYEMPHIHTTSNIIPHAHNANPHVHHVQTPHVHVPNVYEFPSVPHTPQVHEEHNESPGLYSPQYGHQLYQEPHVDVAPQHHYHLQQNLSPGASVEYHGKGAHLIQINRHVHQQPVPHSNDHVDVAQTFENYNPSILPGATGHSQGLINLYQNPQVEEQGTDDYQYSGEIANGLHPGYTDLQLPVHLPQHPNYRPYDQEGFVELPNGIIQPANNLEPPYK